MSELRKIENVINAWRCVFNVATTSNSENALLDFARSHKSELEKKSERPEIRDTLSIWNMAIVLVTSGIPISGIKDIAKSHMEELQKQKKEKAMEYLKNLGGGMELNPGTNEKRDDV